MHLLTRVAYTFLTEERMLDQRLIDVLVCPQCRGTVEYKPRRNVVICAPCQLRFAVKDDIPVMLVAEATRSR